MSCEGQDLSKYGHSDQKFDLQYVQIILLVCCLKVRLCAPGHLSECLKTRLGAGLPVDKLAQPIVKTCSGELSAEH